MMMKVSTVIMGTVALVSSLAHAQEITLHIQHPEVNKQVWINNAVYQTNESRRFERAAMARVLLQEFKQAPNTSEPEAIHQMQDFDHRYPPLPRTSPQAVITVALKRWISSLILPAIYRARWDAQLRSLARCLTEWRMRKTKN